MEWKRVFTVHLLRFFEPTLRYRFAIFYADYYQWERDIKMSIIAEYMRLPLVLLDPANLLFFSQVCRVDSELDRVHLIPRATNDDFFAEQSPTGPKVTPSRRIIELQSIVKSLSTTSSSSPLLSSWRISQLLERASLSEVVAEGEHDPATSKYETELEWLLVSKATVQTYGLLLSTLLEQTIPLNDEIWYWDEVLGSYTYSSLYMAQKSPLRLWYWTADIYSGTRDRLARLRGGESESALSARDIGISLSDQWKQFYGLVRETIAESSIAQLQHQVLSPMALCRSHARYNQTRLRRLREMGASGLGMLMDEGLNFGIHDENTDISKTGNGDVQEWKFVVERSVALMDTVLRNVTTLDSNVSDFEDNVFASVDEDPEITTRETLPTEAARYVNFSFHPRFNLPTTVWWHSLMLIHSGPQS